MKHCAYCEQPILGTAVPVADDAGTGAHAPAYWHANKGECGPRVLRTSPRDDDRR
ncbi:hypothetical protein ABZ567_06050 [Streptomyces sp. NPDC016459]|uniref:hypothetical protein n=1 Tax=Streptomyces sp. NPDC016459 TaxID=3157190 RepID=UPI0033D553B5